MRLLFFLGVALFYSCHRIDMEYPMELTIHGPYYKDDYDRLRDSFWLERAIDIKEANVFYILELLNTSTDTISIAVSKDIGNVCCHYLCFIPLRNAIAWYKEKVL
ncbi:MAG: hypothetical protein IPJ00_05175 [Saprospirales bacterium]|nr:hypothetical protein [Saprospirales bacterium]